MLAINLHVANPTAANSIAARILSTTSGQIFTNGNLTQEVAYVTDADNGFAPLMTAPRSAHYLLSRRRRANSKQYTAYALTAIARCAQMARFTPTNLFASPKFIATFTMFSQYANSAKPWPYADKDPSSTYSWKFWAGMRNRVDCTSLPLADVDSYTFPLVIAVEFSLLGRRPCHIRISTNRTPFLTTLNLSPRMASPCGNRTQKCGARGHVQRYFWRIRKGVWRATRSGAQVAVRQNFRFYFHYSFYAFFFTVICQK